MHRVLGQNQFSFHCHILAPQRFLLCDPPALLAVMVPRALGWSDLLTGPLGGVARGLGQ